jgi:hypothetical protein
MHNATWIIGWILHGFVAFTLITAGGVKLVKPPQKIIDNFTRWKLLPYLRLIGVGELAAGILLALPHTSMLGTLVASASWGGAIMVHMTHEENYTPVAVFALLTWVGAILKAPSAFGL